MPLLADVSPGRGRGEEEVFVSCEEASCDAGCDPKPAGRIISPDPLSDLVDSMEERVDGNSKAWSEELCERRGCEMKGYACGTFVPGTEGGMKVNCELDC